MYVSSRHPQRRRLCVVLLLCFFQLAYTQQDVPVCDTTKQGCQAGTSAALASAEQLTAQADRWNAYCAAKKQELVCLEAAKTQCPNLTVPDCELLKKTPMEWKTAKGTEQVDCSKLDCATSNVTTQQPTGNTTTTGGTPPPPPPPNTGNTTTTNTTTPPPPPPPPPPDTTTQTNATNTPTNTTNSGNVTTTTNTVACVAVTTCSEKTSSLVEQLSAGKLTWKAFCEAYQQAASCLVGCATPSAAATSTCSAFAKNVDTAKASIKDATACPISCEANSKPAGAEEPKEKDSDSEPKEIPPSSDEKGPPLEMIIGIVIGVSLLMVLGGVAWLVQMSRKAKRLQGDFDEGDVDEEEITEDGEYGFEFNEAE